MWQDKTIIYVDMDHTLCDYANGFKAHAAKYPEQAFPQSIPGLYLNLEPLPDAIDTYRWLHEQPQFAVFILTAPSILNPHSYSEKRLWVEQHLGMDVVENLIISPHKGLNRGHYLIDDCESGKGQEYFEGQLIQFGGNEFPNWDAVKQYFKLKLSSSCVDF